MSIQHEEFEQLVEEALRELPSRFATLLDNVAVIVEDEPSADDLTILDDGVAAHGHTELLGLFRGIPMTRRSYGSLPMLPTQIAIFRGPILRVTHTRAAAIQQIKDTVIHELGHYFGLSDGEMPY